MAVGRLAGTRAHICRGHHRRQVTAALMSQQGNAVPALWKGLGVGERGRLRWRNAEFLLSPGNEVSVGQGGWCSLSSVNDHLQSHNPTRGVREAVTEEHGGAAMLFICILLDRYSQPSILILPRQWSPPTEDQKSSKKKNCTCCEHSQTIFLDVFPKQYSVQLFTVNTHCIGL